jgi:SOS-response transcriptional repressor LexA
MTSKNNPKARPAEILAFMREHLERQQRLPSIRDICARFGLRSTYAAHKHMESMESRGMIHGANGLARGYRLVGVRVRLEAT